MNAWIAILGVGFGTYALRSTMFMVLRDRAVPGWAERPLTHLGPAAIGALLASMMFVAQQSPTMPRVGALAALTAGFAVVRRTGNVVHALTVGLPVLWIVDRLLQ
ncbi:MAG: AzlD domain-containing protein [Ilumatobacter sp.]